MVSKKLALLEHTETEKKQVIEKKNDAENQESIYLEASSWLRDLYGLIQERYHGQIMQIVTYCLREVFGSDAYDFKINFSQKRGQVEASLVFERDGEQFDPVHAAGGGVLAVACFALRLAVLYLTKQSVRPVMIMDEPFVQLSVEYRERMSALLEELSFQFGFQFILVTHEAEFCMGKIYKFDEKHCVKEVPGGTR